MTTYKQLDRELARRAFYNTSFSPEKRGDSQVDYHKGVFDELQKELGDFFEQKHADKLHDLWTAYLHSHSSVMSSMITGPANFPVERNRKKSEWADKKNRAIFEYCDNLRKWKRKAEKREAVAAAGGELEMKKVELSEARLIHSDMKSINRCIKVALRKEGGLTRGDIESFKILYPSLGADEVERVCRRDDYYGYGFQSFTLTNSNARIKNMEKRITELKRREEAKESGEESETVKIPNGFVIVDKVENRINVKHDEKPNREIIALIKENGFRWSRNYGTWTRKLTNNAIYSAKRLIKALNELEEKAA